MGTATLISLEEFERLDTGADEAELLRGELIRVPPPILRHMEICHQLLTRLRGALASLRISRPDLPLGEAYIEMGYLLSTKPRSWLRPDVSVTHRDQAAGRFYLGAPLMVFEVASDSDTAVRLKDKIAAYLETGAAEVWVIYPDQGHAWVQYSTGTARLETDAITSELLPGAAIPLSALLQ